MNEQKNCLNPDISLTELYHIRNGYKNQISALKKSNDNPLKLKEITNSFIEVGEKITKIENAMQTGGIVRLM